MGSTVVVLVVHGEGRERWPVGEIHTHFIIVRLLNPCPSFPIYFSALFIGCLYITPFFLLSLFPFAYLGLSPPYLFIICIPFFSRFFLPSNIFSNSMFPSPFLTFIPITSHPLALFSLPIVSLSLSLHPCLSLLLSYLW